MANTGLQNSYPAETVAVVSLLHDICKVNFYKKGFRNVKDEETGQWYKKEVYGAEFQRYIDNTLQEAGCVRTYCAQDEIVLIMTADFYRELLATTDIHANRDGDHYGFLYGYRIALINEPTERTMVSPAVLGMTYYPGMALDDIIVVNEAN